MRKHALLSASGADRWLNCTPSARLEERFNESASTSSFAEEGSLAHEFAELNLRFCNSEIKEKDFRKELSKLRTNKLYSPSEMEDEVAKYVSVVMESFNVAKQITGDAKLLIEQRLDFSYLVEHGFGTGDACIIADGVLEIIDLKYGKGVQVFAEDNAQLQLYGLGALRVYELLYDVHTIRMTIVQPRLNHVSSSEMPVSDLVDWGETVVRAKAAEAYEGNGEAICGKWCKWCKVKGMCSTLAEQNLELAKLEFKEPYLLSDEDILRIVPQIPMLVDWAKSVEEYMLKTALQGVEWEGFKLVEGKSTRSFTNEEGVRQALLEKGFAELDFTKTSLLGIPAIEKLVGKKEFQNLLGVYVDKPQGKPTLAPLNDKRQPFGLASAVAAFKNLELD